MRGVNLTIISKFLSNYLECIHLTKANDQSEFKFSNTTLPFIGHFLFVKGCPRLLINANEMIFKTT